MNSKLKFFLTLGIGIIIVMFLFYAISSLSKLTGKTVITGAAVDLNLDLDNLAKCLTEKGAMMYGTSWCGYCQSQKKMFGSSFLYVDYVDCDERPEDCQKAGIKGYPTWIIGGKQYSGAQSSDNLRQLTGC